MSIILPELEIVDSDAQSLRYLEHGWPDPLCRWHVHKECELHLILDTNGKAFVGDYIGDFSPGSLFLTGPHLPHNWITDDIWPKPVAMRDMVIQFDQDRIEQLFTAFGEFQEIRSLLDLSQSGIEFINFDADYAQARLAEIRDSSGPDQILIFLKLLTAMAAHSDKKTLSVLMLVHPDGGSKQARVGEVVNYIMDHFADELSVDAAADMAKMSPTTFSRNFLAVTGNRFVEFVTRVRIGQACSMLYATDEQISSISFGVGFQNLANFNRYFLKMKAMTPTKYREIARSELAPKPEHKI